MEAMASGLSITCSNIRGNSDLIKEPLFNPKDSEDIRKAIIAAIENKEQLGRQNYSNIKSFELQKVEELMTRIYENTGMIN